MLKKLDKCTVFSVIFFVTVFLFWWLYKPEALYYQEIFQLFAWDSSYFADLVSIPGGMADYVSEFLVQFYYYPVLGAAIIAAVFTGLVILVFQLAKYFHDGRPEFNILHTLPAMMLWYVMYDINVMHNYMVALLMALLISWLCLSGLRSGSGGRAWASLSAIPLGYFLFGPVVLIPLIISIVYILRRGFGHAYYIGALLALALVIAVSAHYVLYPLPRFLYGIDYYRYHGFNWWMLVVACFFVLAPLAGFGSQLTAKKYLLPLQCAAWALVLYLVVSAYEPYKYQTLKYLKMTHECKWKEIVEDASVHTPEAVYSMMMVNTALAFEQKLADSMFQFPQEGPYCLIPDLDNDMLQPLLVADALYWMGLNDHAIHYYFESKTGNPTYRGSRFSYMRLAECYMVNGDYGVAYKYLNQLKKTLFFKEKAMMYINLIETGRVAEDPLFATLRSIKLQTNGLQAANQIADSFRSLLKENPYNYLAFEYLMGFRLLTCDLAGLAEDVSLGQKLGYKELPMHIQEALIYFWNSHNGNIDRLPSSISHEVRTRFQKKLIADDSYWQYLLDNKDKQYYEDEHEIQ